MKILSICLSPALQKIYEFENLTIGTVNRSLSFNESAGGKGINVGRTLSCLEADHTVLTTYGGNIGKDFLDILEDEDLKYIAVEVENETRICSTLIDSKNITFTELVEETKELYKAEINKFKKMFDKIIGSYNSVVITGSVPDGVNNDVYGYFTRYAKSFGLTVMVDALGPLLINTLEYKPHIIKINKMEFEQSFNVMLSNEQIIKEQLLDKAKYVEDLFIITDEEKPIYFVEADASTIDDVKKIVIPEVEVMNPIGSGDALIGGLAYSYSKMYDMDKALLFSIGCSIANALNTRPGFLKYDDADFLMKKLTIE